MNKGEGPNLRRSLAGDTRWPQLIPASLYHHFQFPSQKTLSCEGTLGNQAKHQHKPMLIQGLIPLVNSQEPM
jgi:hypothetical protein